MNNNISTEPHTSETFETHQEPLQETVYLGNTIDINPEAALLKSEVPELQEIAKDISFERNARVRQTAEYTAELVRKNIVIEKLGFDSVTGLATRPIFDRDIEAYVNRNDPGTALIIYDLLGLNRANDDKNVGGHDVGDKYLAVATRAIVDTSRPGDRNYRIGGDELSSILSGLIPDSNGSYDAVIQAAIDNKKEAVMEALHAAGLPVDELYLGMSAGGTVLDGEHKTTSEEILKIADTAMFEDKREFYESLPEDVRATLKKDYTKSNT